MTLLLLAQISRDFFSMHGVYQYRIKKVIEMDDQEVIRCCHWYCEENNLTVEFEKYRKKAQAEYVYCSYIQQYVPEGLCYDMQMVKDGFIKSSALPEIKTDREVLQEHCAKCKNSL